MLRNSRAACYEVSLEARAQAQLTSEPSWRKTPVIAAWLSSLEKGPEKYPARSQENGSK